MKHNCLLKLGLITVLTALLLSGCAKHSDKNAESPATEKTSESPSAEAQTDAAEEESALAGIGSSADPQWAYKESTDTNQNIVLKFSEVTLTLPSSWADKYTTKESDGSITFYDKASLEAGEKKGQECGSLFTLGCEENYTSITQLPRYFLVGTGESKIYYITFPGDSQGYADDPEILQNWTDMSSDVTQICEDAVAANEGVPLYTTDDVNLHKEESEDSDVLAVVPSGTIVKARGSIDALWMDVDFNGQDGYMDTAYLSFTKPAVSETQTESPAQTETSAQTDAASSGTGNTSSSETASETTGSSGSSSSAETSSETDESESLVPSGETNSSGQEIYFILDQGAEGDFSIEVYDADGNGVVIRQATDGNYYDENGIKYGNWEYMENLSDNTPITNENGKTYYIAPQKASGNTSEGQTES